MISADQLGAVIAKIYQAPLSGAAWMPALKAVEDLTLSTLAPMQILPKDGSAKRIMIGSPAPEAGLREWFEDYLPRCKRIAYGLSHPVGVLRYDYLLMTEHEMERDPVYQYYERLDYRYFLGMKLYEDDRYVVLFSLQRRRKLGHAQGEDISLFNLIAPHIRQALQLSASLQTLKDHAGATTDHLNSSTKAVILLSQSGRLLFANAAAEQLFQSASGLSLKDAKLIASDPKQQRRLNVLIASAFKNGSDHWNRWMRLSRPNGGRSHSLHISRLHAPDDGSLFGLEKVVAITISSDATVIDTQMARELFGLTQSETNVGCAIAAGHSIESCAAVLGVSPHTVRIHLKAIFKKLGVNRQQDLCRILVGTS